MSNANKSAFLAKITSIGKTVIYYKTNTFGKGKEFRVRRENDDIGAYRELEVGRTYLIGATIDDEGTWTWNSVEDITDRVELLLNGI